MNNIPKSIEQLTSLQRALLALEKMQAKLDAFEQERSEPIAIIGMGCRFPGDADSPEAFWRLLENGIDAIVEVPKDRWDIDSYYSPDPEALGKVLTRYSGFIKQADKFDPQFFGITPREATSMDPQQRLLLEVAWESLEAANLPHDQLTDSQTGVFVGIMTNDYMQLYARSDDLDSIDAYYGSGNGFSFAAGRLSYLLGLHGPSLALDTACSSSLVAVHLACQSLRLKECNLALAGGVNLMLTPDTSTYLSRAKALAPDGRCKTFDAAADGYSRGEGCGVIVLKRLSDALANHDRILALIRSSATNHGGPSGGLTVPNGLAQQAVIRAALEHSGIKPAEVDYVETHGSGTSLGDPIEVQALSAVLSEGRSPDHPLVLGAVKTNIGHLEAAAGIAGLIKVVLSMQHKQIPANLHFKTINPHISLEQIPAAIPTTLMPWHMREHKRIAGVSSFGLSGTNAHVILEEAPAPQDAESAPIEHGWHLLNLSAKSDTALKELAERYAQVLPNMDLRDASYTSQLGRSHFSHRLAVVAGSSAQAAERLQAFAQGAEPAGVHAGVVPQTLPKVVFVFPGQGSQWIGMGQQLMQSEPVFRETMEQCAQHILKFADWSLLHELALDEEHSHLTQIDIIQPALFAIQVSLASMWQSWGIQPGAVIGHSMGEVAAAYIAGALSLEDAVRIICGRSHLLKRKSGQGSMVLVELPLESAKKALAGYTSDISVAASNSPRSTVLSGDTHALEKVIQALQEHGILCRWIKVDVASHSPQMDSLTPELLKFLEGIQPQVARVPIYSTVEACPCDGSSFHASYWVRNLREPVLFSTTIQSLLNEGFNLFLEISPHPILLQDIDQGANNQNDNTTLLPSLRRGEDERKFLLTSLGICYTLGLPIDWQAVQQGNGIRHTSLPTYPFQRQRFWLKTNNRTGHSVNARGLDEILFKIEWQTAEEEKPSATLDGKWLVIGGGKLGDRLYELLPQSTPLSLDTFDPNDPEPFKQQLSVLLQESWTGVIHLAALDPEGELPQWCGSALVIAQALASCERMSLPYLWLVTCGAQLSVSDPWQASLWGLGRSLAREHPELWGGLIDLDPDDPSPEHIISALCSPHENQSAYRQGQRFVPRLVYASADISSLSIHTDATYLITGGLKGLGWQVAQWLAQQGAGALVLMGRSAPSPETQEQLEQMREAGCQVMTFQCDVSRADELSHILTQVSVQLSPLRGIIHCAGVLEDATLLHQDWAHFESVLAPKAQGAWNLHSLTKDIPLDFFVLFSSVASVFGSPGQSNHATANACLDALAHYRRALGLPALSLNWGPWSEIGKAAHPASSNPHWQQQGMQALSVARSMKAFELLLASNSIQTAVFSMDWHRVESEFTGNQGDQLLSLLIARQRDHAPVDPASRAPKLLAQLEKASSSERRPLLIEHIRSEVSRVLGFDSPESIGIQSGFFEMGMDSLMSVQLKNRLQSSLGCFLPPTLTFNYPTIEALANFLLVKLSFDNSRIIETPATSTLQQETLENVRQLSEKEVEAMIDAELKSLLGNEEL